MKKTITTLGALLLVSPAALTPAGGPSFGVEEGATLAKRFESSGELVLDDVEVTMNGQDADPAQMGWPTDLGLSLGYELACSDTYEKVDALRPLVLLRSFDTLEYRYEDQSGEGESEEAGELVGRTVRFAWDPDGERYERSFEGEGGDEESLENLSADLDLNAILPDGEVEPGDTWVRDGFALLGLILPGVDLSGALDELEGVPEDLLEMLERLEVVCEYVGEVEQDGVRLGQIDVSASLDESSAIDPSMLGDGQEGVVFDVFDATLSLEYAGTVLWDLAAGRPHSFEGGGDGDVSIEIELSVAEYDLSIEGEAEFTLSLEQTASVE